MYLFLEYFEKLYRDTCPDLTSAAPWPAGRRHRAATTPARIAQVTGREGARARCLQHWDTAPAHEQHQYRAGDEASDMRPDGDTADIRSRALGAQKLHEEPEAEKQDRRHGDDAKDDDDP